jgi:hypothetical protein
VLKCAKERVKVKARVKANTDGYGTGTDTGATHHIGVVLCSHMGCCTMEYPEQEKECHINKNWTLKAE